MIGALTIAYKRLRANDQSSLLTLSRKARMLEYGFALGSSTYLMWLITLTANGWASLPAWGWHRNSLQAVTYALFVNTLGHLAVAFNEEQIFRGYGFDTWRQAVGPVGAATMLTALFALSHRPTTLAGWSGYATLGMVCTGLRLIDGSVWLPIGYHWGWNLIQTGILGHEIDRASLRPVIVDGPSAWVGKTSPETGWITTILNLIVILGLFLWRRKRTSLKGTPKS
jgi:membrane protease YdiL (CAAX protease family)